MTVTCENLYLNLNWVDFQFVCRIAHKICASLYETIFSRRSFLLISLSKVSLKTNIYPVIGTAQVLFHGSLHKITVALFLSVTVTKQPHRTACLQRRRMASLKSTCKVSIFFFIANGLGKQTPPAFQSILKHPSSTKGVSS